MNRELNLRAARKQARHAAERGQAAVDEAVEHLTPLVEQAAELLEQASEKVSPIAREYRAKGAAALDQAVERLTPLVEQASDRLTEAGERLGPVAREYRMRGAAAAAQALDNLQPKINHALDRAAPAVDAAQRRVQDELIPKLVTLLHEAATSPTLAEAAERAAELQPTKKRKVGATIAKLAAAGALVAGVAVAVRVFLQTKENGWAAHEPSAAYVYAEEPVTVEETELADVEVEDIPDVEPDSSSDADTSEFESAAENVDTESAGQVGEAKAI